MLQDRTWLLIGRKMANEATSQELKELEDILRANPELHFSLQAIADLWQQIPSHDSHELEKAYQNHLQQIKNSGEKMPGQPEKSLFRIPAVRLLISLAAATLVVFLSVNYFTQVKSAQVTSATADAPSEISTRYGSKTNIVLPDGTRVWLNAGSKLTYNKAFGEASRDVVLTGEAYFDVTHNSERPFVIHTRVMDIKVLGTEFNVKSYPEERTTETSLIHGSIEVVLRNRNAEKIFLKPNEKLVVTEEKPAGPVTVPLQKNIPEQPLISVSHLNYFSRDSTILETSWVQNRLVFEDESFADLAKRMSRWYGYTFYFADPKLEKLRFTGNLQNESIEEALAAMKITANFTYSISDKHITLNK